MSSKVTLSQLEAFRAIAEHLSYTMAGKSLGYSESAVYQQVRALQQSLQVDLLAIRHRRLELTEVGAELAPLANGVVDAARAFEQAAQRFPHRRRLQVRLATDSVTGGFLLRHVLGDFDEAHPDISLEVEIRLNRKITAEMLRGKYDLGVVKEPEASGASALGDLGEDFNAVPWVEDEWMLVTANPELTARAASVPRRVYYVATRFGGARTDLNRLLEEANLAEPFEYAPQPAVELVKAAVAGCLGYGFLPGMLAASELEEGTFVPSEARGLRRSVFLVVPQEPKPAVAAVRDFLVQWAESHDDWYPWLAED